MPNIPNLTNGAAHWAFFLLSQSKLDLDKIFVSGSLAVKLKRAKNQPKPEEGESSLKWQERSELWMDQPYGDVEVNEEEWVLMRELLRELGKSKALPGNYHISELAQSFKLHEKS